VLLLDPGDSSMWSGGVSQDLPQYHEVSRSKQLKTWIYRIAVNEVTITRCFFRTGGRRSVLMTRAKEEKFRR